MEILIVVVIVAVIVGYIVSIYNNLVNLRNRYKNAFAQIEVQLKRRYDLIPNIVNTCKGYMKHERETFEAIVNARNEAQKCLEASAGGEKAEGVKSLSGAESNLTGALNALRVTVESYPELKADTTMAQLNEELSSTENKVAFSRQAYNDMVMAFNTAKQSFPANMFANKFGFSEDAQLLEFEDSKLIKEAPKVEF